MMCAADLLPLIVNKDAFLQLSLSYSVSLLPVFFMMSLIKNRRDSIACFCFTFRRESQVSDVSKLLVRPDSPGHQKPVCRSVNPQDHTYSKSAFCCGMADDEACVVSMFGTEGLASMDTHQVRVTSCANSDLRCSCS